MTVKINVLKLPSCEDIRFRTITEKETSYIYHKNKELPTFQIENAKEPMVFFACLYQEDGVRLHVHQLTSTSAGCLDHNVFKRVFNQEFPVFNLKLGIKVYTVEKNKNNREIEKIDWINRSKYMKVPTEIFESTEDYWKQVGSKVNRHVVKLKLILYCKKDFEESSNPQPVHTLSYTIRDSKATEELNHEIAHLAISEQDRELILVCPKVKKDDCKVCFRLGNWKLDLFPGDDKCKLYGNTTFVISLASFNDMPGQNEILVSVRKRKEDPDYPSLLEQLLNEKLLVRSFLYKPMGNLSSSPLQNQRSKVREKSVSNPGVGNPPPLSTVGSVRSRSPHGGTDGRVPITVLATTDKYAAPSHDLGIDNWTRSSRLGVIRPPNQPPIFLPENACIFPPVTLVSTQSSVQSGSQQRPTDIGESISSLSDGVSSLGLGDAMADVEALVKDISKEELSALEKTVAQSMNTSFNETSHN